MSLWVLIEIFMIWYRMILVFSEYCRETFEPVVSDRDVDNSVSDVIAIFRVLSRELLLSLWVLIEMSIIQYWTLLLFSEYCRENYEPVVSDRDVDDSVSDVIAIFRVLSR